MNLAHVGFNPDGAIIMDATAENDVPTDEAVRWAQSLLSRCCLAKAQGNTHVTTVLSVRVLLTAEHARALANDLEERAEEFERRRAFPSLAPLPLNNHDVPQEEGFA